MQARSEKSAGRDRTFTEKARREQIVAAAIETIAELGYARASFAQIAQRAGLSSTGLISYHFAGKSELVEQVVIQVYSEISRFMAQRLDAQPSASHALRAYIEGQIEFAWNHRTQMKALLDIFLSGGLNYDDKAEREAVSPVEEILRRGQESGEFRDFDVPVMATTVQRAVEGPTFLLGGDPGLDMASYAHELVTLFSLATAKQDGGS